MKGAFSSFQSVICFNSVLRPTCNTKLDPNPLLFHRQSEEGGAGAAQFASGSAFEFGVDPNEDPELALVSEASLWMKFWLECFHVNGFKHLNS